MVYDITNPFGAQYLGYLNDLDFTANMKTTVAGDLGLQGRICVAADQMRDGIQIK